MSDYRDRAAVSISPVHYDLIEGFKQKVDVLRKRVKDEAKAIRARLKEETGIDKSHGHCLNVVSVLYGYRDWNTLSALINREPDEVEARMNKVAEP